MHHIGRSKSLVSLVFLGMITGACAAGDTDAPSLADGPIQAKAQASTTATSPDGRYIVTYESERGRAAMAAAVTAAGGHIARELGQHHAAAVYLPEAALAGLRNNPAIARVEVDARRYPMAEITPYGIPMVQADQVPAAPPAGDAGRVKLCIIDSGLSAAHEDLAGLPVDGSDDSGSGAWNKDLCGHGTHVGGTVAAVAGNGVGVVGVAPEAVSLHIVKVFAGESCGWSYSSDLVAALDACVESGAQVVSMSLGGGFKNRTEERAFARAFDSGVLSVAAAGNDGSKSYSYPASYDAVVSVAAVDSTKTVADFSQKNDQVELAAPGVDVRSTYPYTHHITVSGTRYDGNGIEHAAQGTASGALVAGGLCDTTGAWTGKVVLCERGAISFFDKVMNVQSSGGAAAVIYNNAPGNFNGTLGDGNASDIPAISLSQEDGQHLVANELGQAGDVLSGLGDGYASLSGTSMATPHVSAVAALVWAQVSTATNADIRDALTATAEDLGSAGYDTSYGYGLVQAKAALDHLLGGGGDPDCSADGVCNPACAPGADPDCGNACYPAGAACTFDGDCCSNKCKGKPGARTCK